MKQLLVFLMALTLTYSGNVEAQKPAPSPLSKLEQKVGFTVITIEYSRPGVKGRTIFGELVPYGEVWRTGANAKTKITFSTDVTISGKAIKAGTYAIYTIPNPESWDFILYTDYEGNGTPSEWDETKVAVKIAAKPDTMAFDVETFTLDVNNIKDTSATIDLIWSNTYLGVPFEVPAK